MKTSSFRIRFLETTSGQANRWAGELKDALLDVDPTVRVRQEREHADTMDLGTVLQVASGSAVLVQVLKTLEAWLGKRRDAAVELSDGKRTLKLNGVSPETALAQAKTFFDQGTEPGDADDA